MMRNSPFTGLDGWLDEKRAEIESLKPGDPIIVRTGESARFELARPWPGPVHFILPDGRRGCDLPMDIIVPNPLPFRGSEPQ